MTNKKDGSRGRHKIMNDQIEVASTHNDEIDLKALLMAILDTKFG
ncbi:hypothetical protein N9A64_06235 [Pseudomonadales bacterium]|nr:hypothetical protein [Pseudomonadales bacterium]